MQIRELKRIITEIKNSLHGFNSRSESEERIHELEDKSTEIVQSEASREKRAGPQRAMRCHYGYLSIVCIIHMMGGGEERQKKIPK